MGAGSYASARASALRSVGRLAGSPPAAASLARSRAARTSAPDTRGRRPWAAKRPRATSRAAASAGDGDAAGSGPYTSRAWAGGAAARARPTPTRRASVTAPSGRRGRATAPSAGLVHADVQAWCRARAEARLDPRPDLRLERGDLLRPGGAPDEHQELPVGELAAEGRLPGDARAARIGERGGERGLSCMGGLRQHVGQRGCDGSPASSHGWVKLRWSDGVGQ